VFRLPLEDEVTLGCGWSVGGLTDWLDYDHAQPWGALPAAE
jgi:hypothetical protein